jgi:long-chain acyl-CoA synthetase
MAVPLSHSNLLQASMRVSTILQLTDDDVFLNALPNFNAFGFVCGSLKPLVKGTCQVVLRRSCPRRGDGRHEERSCHDSAGGPYHKIPPSGAAARGVTPPRTLRYILSGGDRLPLDFDNRAQETLGVPVIEGYGLTEAAFGRIDSPRK